MSASPLIAAKLNDGESANNPPTPGSAEAPPWQLAANISNPAFKPVTTRRMRPNVAPMGRMVDSSDAWQTRKRPFGHQMSFTNNDQRSFSRPQINSFAYFEVAEAHAREVVCH